MELQPQSSVVDSSGNISRNMTDQSFSSCCNGPYPTLITPERHVPVTTSRASKSTPINDGDLSVQQLRITLEIEKQMHQETLKCLLDLSEGVRIVTKQMKRQENSSEEQNNDRSRTCSSSTRSSSYASEDDRRLSDLTSSSRIGADLMTLSHTASVINVHAQLSWEDASVLTKDITELHATAFQQTQRALKAEKGLRKLCKVTHDMNQQIDVMKVEKKVLVKEVRLLRKSIAAYEAMKKEDTRNNTLSALEIYVAGILQFHETILKQAVHSKAEQKQLYHVLESDTSNDDGSVMVTTTNIQGTQTDPVGIAALNIVSNPSTPLHTKSIGFGAFSGGALGFGNMKKFQNAHMKSVERKSSIKEELSTESVKLDVCKSKAIVKSEVPENETTSSLIMEIESSEKENRNRSYAPIQLSCRTPIQNSQQFFSYSSTPTIQKQGRGKTPSYSDVASSDRSSVPSNVSLLSSFTHQLLSPFSDFASPLADANGTVTLASSDSIVLRSLSLPEEMSKGGDDNTLCPVEISRIYDEIECLYEC